MTRPDAMMICAALMACTPCVVPDGDPRPVTLHPMECDPRLAHLPLVLRVEPCLWPSIAHDTAACFRRIGG